MVTDHERPVESIVTHRNDLERIQTTCNDMTKVMVSIQNRTLDQYFRSLYENIRDVVTGNRLKGADEIERVGLEFDYTFFYASENFMPAVGHTAHLLSTRKQLELFAKRAADCINRTDMRIARLMRAEELESFEKELYLYALAARKLSAQGVAVIFDIPDEFDHFPSILVYSPVEQSWIMITLRACEFE